MLPWILLYISISLPLRLCVGHCCMAKRWSAFLLRACVARGVALTCMSVADQSVARGPRGPKNLFRTVFVFMITLKAKILSALSP